MDITFKQYISNPTGGRSRIVGEEQLARQTYSKKYDQVMLKVAGNIEYWLFKVPDGRKYYLYVKVPSESIEKLTYDTVIEFYTQDDVNTKSQKLDNYYIKFFSNDPNFLFTYAYTFNQHGLIIPELKSKIEKVFFSEKPKVTNPNKTIGYVKSFYFVYLLYESANLAFKHMWVNAKRYNKNELYSMIMDSEKKRQQVNDLKELSKGIKNKTVRVNNKDDLNSLKFKAQSYSNLKKSQKSHATVRTQQVKRTNRVKTVKYIK